MMFDKDLQDQPVQEGQLEVDIKNQMSTIYTNSRLTPFPSFTPLLSFSPFENPQMDVETSLDRELYRHNAQMIRKGIVCFLSYCLNRPIDDSKAFLDGNIFCFQCDGIGNEHEELVDALIVTNKLLTPWKKKQMAGVFESYRDLKGVIREVKNMCGRSITQEIVYILAEVLERKLGKLEELQVCEMDEVVPRMQRFWGDDNDEYIVKGGWNVYCQVDYDQVKQLAAADLEPLGSMLYFSKYVRYLVLSSVNSDLIEQVNLVDKFTTLVTFISEGLLLSMEGISQKDEDLEAFTIDLHYTTSVDGEVEEHSTKKIKIDDE